MDSLISVPLSEKEAALKSPLSLAFLGDTVWDLMVRQELLQSQAKAGTLHKIASQRVNAASQAKAISILEPCLTQEELAIYHRGRNAHCHHNPPKNQTPLDYSLSSGLEALVGYLYLTGQNARLHELFQTAFSNENKEAY